MKILAIESSCDETAAAVLEGTGVLSFSDDYDIKVDLLENSDLKLLSNVVVSQVDIFAGYGGVIPEVAARSHLEVILPVIDKALEDAELTKDDIDAIAVTHTPGLLGSLLIGTLTARMLAILWKKPLFAVHHLKSHIYANWLTAEDSPIFPLLALVVSGGHTQIIYMRDHNQFEIIGTTRDDAVGECFDKVAKILGLPYPGGPSVAKCAEKGDPLRYKLPHPQVGGLDFSFSGLKTAVLRAVQAELGLPISTPSYELASKLSEQQKADFAASFQKTAVDVLLDKLEMALKVHSEAKTVVLAGGVSANKVLREKALERLILSEKGAYNGQGCCSQNAPQRGGILTRNSPKYCQLQAPFSLENSLSSDFEPVRSQEIQVFFPDLKLAGDNAAMVGAAAYFEIISGVEPTDPYSLDIMPRVGIR